MAAGRAVAFVRRSPIPTPETRNRQRRVDPRVARTTRTKPATDLQPSTSSRPRSGNSRLRDNGQIMLGFSAPQKQPSDLPILPRPHKGAENID